MARVALTKIRGTLKISTVLLTLLTEVFRGVKEAAGLQVLLKFKVDAVEHAAAAIPVAKQKHVDALAREKYSRGRMRELAIGAVAFFEALRPELKGKLPILSKPDPTTCYLLIDEMARVAESDSEIAPLAGALQRSKDEHLNSVAEVARTDSERDDLAIAHNLACLDLDKTVKEVRMFVISNSAKDAPYLKQLKRSKPSPRKPAEKPEPKAELAVVEPLKLVEVVDAAPKKDDVVA